MTFVAAWSEASLTMAGNLAPLLLMGWILERLLALGRISTESQLRSLRYWAIQTAASALIVVTLGLWQDALPEQPLYILPLREWLFYSPIAWLSFVLSPFIAFTIIDFFQYWMHRAQHRFFWRQHSIHHSIEELSFVNSYFHWTEELIRSAFITLPITLLIGVDAAPTFLMITILNNLHGLYLHSPARLHFGSKIRRVLADNRFHRIHHSKEEIHFDKNFGAFTSIWDQVFGTAYFPSVDEWPDTGVADAPEPVSVSDYLWRPFRSSDA